MTNLDAMTLHVSHHTCILVSVQARVRLMTVIAAAECKSLSSMAAPAGRAASGMCVQTTKATFHCLEAAQTLFGRTWRQIMAGSSLLRSRVKSSSAKQMRGQYQHSRLVEADGRRRISVGARPASGFSRNLVRVCLCLLRPNSLTSGDTQGRAALTLMGACSVFSQESHPGILDATSEELVPEKKGTIRPEKQSRASIRYRDCSLRRSTVQKAPS